MANQIPSFWKILARWHVLCNIELLIPVLSFLIRLSSMMGWSFLLLTDSRIWMKLCTEGCTCSWISSWSPHCWVFFYLCVEVYHYMNTRLMLPIFPPDTTWTDCWYHTNIKHFIGGMGILEFTKHVTERPYFARLAEQLVSHIMTKDDIVSQLQCNSYQILLNLGCRLFLVNPVI